MSLPPHGPKNKTASFQRPAKFNFLAPRPQLARVDWPLGHTSATAKAAAASKRGSK